MYFFWLGEGQVDVGFDLLFIIFVMAYELFYGYGFGDEGICNFWAYVVCICLVDLFIVYVGYLDYFCIFVVYYFCYDWEVYFVFWEQLFIGIQVDFDVINDNLRKYFDIMLELCYVVYDIYFKVQGIKEGIKNYSCVVMMVKVWKEVWKLQALFIGFFSI